MSLDRAFDIADKHIKAGHEDRNNDVWEGLIVVDVLDQRGPFCEGDIWAEIMDIAYMWYNMVVRRQILLSLYLCTKALGREIVVWE